MFGYIQPLKCELKMREYDYYRAAYCGLCNSLRTRCGFIARFIVNYDFVFIALILSYAESASEHLMKKRCIVCPKGRTCVQSNIYDKSAEISVILAYLKLCDDIEDNSFLKSFFKARIPKLMLTRAYKKATLEIPSCSENIIGLYNELSMLEKSGCPSIDETADKFGLMLASAADKTETTSRILKELFYHIGRFVYIIDALDDFSKDIKKKEYNPIAARFALTSEVLPEDVKQQVLTTLEDSRQAVLRAFNLLGANENEGIIRNIIELGMPVAVSRTIKRRNK